MTTEACPLCKSPVRKVDEESITWFECASAVDANGKEYWIDTECYINQLEAMTRERDNFRDTAAAMMTAACGTDDLDEQERLCNEAGTKPSHFIAKLRADYVSLQERLDKAPLYFVPQGMLDGAPKLEGMNVEFDGSVKVKLVRV